MDEVERKTVSGKSNGQKKLMDYLSGLKESHTILKHVIDKIPDAASVSDIDGYYIFVNEMFCKVMGYDRQEIIGKSIFDFLHPDDASRVGKRFAEGIANGGSDATTFQYRKSDGTYILLETHGNVIPNERNEPIAAMFVSRDVTGIFNTLKQISLSETKFRKFLTVFPDLIFLISRTGDIKDHYVKQRKEYDFDFDALSHDNISEFLPQKLSKRLVKAIGHCVQRRSVETLTFVLPYKGAKLYFEARMVSVDDKDVFLVVSDITKNKLNEKKRIETHQRFKNIINNTSAGYFLLDIELRIVDCNQAFSTILGCGRCKELTGRPITDFFATGSDNIEIVQRFMKSDSLNFSQSISLYDLNGNNIQVALSCNKVFEENVATGFEGFIIDTTELEKVTAALFQKEKEREKLFRVLPMGFAHVELIKQNGQLSDFRIVEVNPQMARLLNREQEEVTQYNVQKFPFTVEYYWIETCGYVARYGLSQRIINYFEAIDKYIELTVFASDADNLALLARDVTSRRKAEMMLVESEQKFRNLTENSHDIILRIDSNGRLVYANNIFFEIFKLSSKSVYGKELTNLKIKGLGAINDLIMQQVIGLEQNLREVVSFELKGRKRYFEWNCLPEFDHKQQLVSAQVMAREITHLKQIQQELEIAKNKAEESDKFKSVFLANLSHEIRTPLNGIVGFSQMIMRDSISNEKKQKYLEIIQSSSDVLMSLINQVIDLSKIELGTTKVLPTRIDLQRLSADFNEFYKHKAQSRNMLFHVDFDECLTDIEFVTDEVKLRQILTNLLNNAFKFTDEGEVKLSILKDNKFMVFEVEDTGVGIPKDQQSRVFEYFRQLENSDDRTYQGAGIGLSIVKSFTESLGGNVYLESVEGEGSLFRIELPSLKTD